METILSQAQWLEKFNSIFQEILLEDLSCEYKYELQIESDYEDEAEDDSDACNVSVSNDKKRYRDLSAGSLTNERLIQMSPLFVGQPEFESVCRDESTQFVLADFTKYRFLSPRSGDSIDKFLKKAHDLECSIHLFGHNLTEVTFQEYPSSKIFKIINNACPNIKRFALQLKEIEDSKDFENMFSNMAHLQELVITWDCKNSTLPISLVKSIEQVGGTLKLLDLANVSGVNDHCLPDAFVSVFPRLIVLDQLYIRFFSHLNQALIQSVAKIESLLILDLATSEVKEPQSNMYPIGNLKRIKVLKIRTDDGVTDEFLINLSTNAKDLYELVIVGTNITDKGMMAFDKFTKLKILDLGSNLKQNKIEFITDESVDYLFFNKNLRELNLSNCIRITNSAVIKLVNNLPNLENLSLKNTNVTFELVKEIDEITKYRKSYLIIRVPFKDRNHCFKSFQAKRVSFVTQMQ